MDVERTPTPKIAAAAGTATGRCGAEAKGGAVITGPALAVFARGAKTAESARLGHELVHGTPEEKRARWEAFADDYQAELERGTGTDAAYYAVAERFGVSDRTIRRAVERMRKID